MKKQKSEYAIQTVENALKLLEAFRDGEELGVTELSRRLDLHKNNVFRLLATLQLNGYIEQRGDSDRYALGGGCLELGQAFLRSRDLLRRARPLLEELATRSSETSHLAVMRDFEVVHLDGSASEQLVATSLRIGDRLPLHCTALGKILLGCSADEVYEDFERAHAADSVLESRTPATIVDPQKLFDQARSASVRGYALDVGECAPGLACVAAPVFGDDGAVVAALSLSGPTFRMDEDRLVTELVPLVTAVAERLSQDLGYATPEA
jgi:DNA-binding IclR family transcriptional regulator